MYKRKQFANIVREITREEIKERIPNLKDSGMNIKLYVVRQSRGRARLFERKASIPRWAELKGNDYFNYYIAHEISHLLATAGHTENFYKCFKTICPIESQKYEYEYKPRKSKSFGIPISVPVND